MKVGDRFEKDGKLVEVTQVHSYGYGYKRVVDEEKPVHVELPVEEEKPVMRRRTATRKKV